MTTEESRNGSVHGDATNEIFQFYQPHYTDFHRTNLFKLNMSKPESITQADVDEVNAVLRKMYESAVMICGEVQNHNPDNLLYNYLNGGDA